jgi:putative endonuclease
MIALYVIESVSKKYRYIGITNNLARRIKQHTQLKSHYAPFKIITTEEFKTYPEAREREKFLKSGVGRKFLDNLK